MGVKDGVGYRLKVIGEGVFIDFNLRDCIQFTGLETYDTALPQEWVDEVIMLTCRSPVGHMVWGYGWDGGLMGQPVAFDQHGAITLTLLKEKRECGAL